MSEQRVEDLAISLQAMTEDEVFATLARLEKESEAVEGSDRDEVFARIALTEEEVESRFPGQVLSPYRVWKQRRTI